MTIEQISDITVKICLSACDLKMYNIDSNSLESSSTNTKLMLIEIISQVQSVINRKLNYEQLFIEAFACSDGGCILYISTMDTDNVPIKKRKIFTDIICESESLEALAALSRHLQKHLDDHILCSELYYKNGSYRLILHTYTKSELQLISIAGEFSEILPANEITKAVTYEYFDCLAEKNALKKISHLQT